MLQGCRKCSLVTKIPRERNHKELGIGPGLLLKNLQTVISAAVIYDDHLVRAAGKTGQNLPHS